MPSFKIIGHLDLEKIFESFYPIWAWPPSWSCDQGHLYKHSFPLPMEAPYKISLIGQAVSEIFENGVADMHGWTLEH